VAHGGIDALLAREGQSNVEGGTLLCDIVSCISDSLSSGRRASMAVV